MTVETGGAMSPGWTTLIALHAVGATVALILGAYLVLRRRKGDLLHRRLGRFWMADMYWVGFSSFGIKRLTPGHFSWIHGLSGLDDLLADDGHLGGEDPPGAAA